MLDETITKAVLDAKIWETAQQKPKALPAHWLEGRKVPEKGSRFLCKVDAAWQTKTRKAGLGWVFWNNTNNLISKHYRDKEYVISALMAEALAMKTALQSALQLGFNLLHVESDSQILVKALINGDPLKEIHGVLCDIRALMSRFHSCQFSFIARTANVMADALAKQALNNSRGN